MSYIDLHNTLRDWPYESEKISVRKILGADGVVRIQMRVELGVVQMEADHRPDGARPFGAETLLAYHKQRLQSHLDANRMALGFALSPQECHGLRIEASLFYRRYVAYFVLEEYDRVVRDTSHSLEILDLCHEHAMEMDDRIALEEFRTYILMMNARGHAFAALDELQPDSALAHVNRGIMNIRACFERQERLDLADTSEEIRILRGLAREINAKVPSDSLLVTRKALREALDHERFEEAARLRDELKHLYPQG